MFKEGIYIDKNKEEEVKQLFKEMDYMQLSTIEQLFVEYWAEHGDKDALYLLKNKRTYRKSHIK